MMNKIRSKLITLTVLSVVTLGSYVIFTAPSIAEKLQITPQKNEGKKLKCIRVNRRFSLCGNSNFKNKFVAGFGIHFSTVDPKGRLTIVGKKRSINSSPKSCDALMKETNVPKNTRIKAVKVCRQMFKEHQTQRLRMN